MGKWTRRGFIAAGVVSGGALMVGVGIREGHRAPKLAKMMTEQGETLVNVWVKLDADNTVTAIVPHSEMGQGVFTSMTQMLADEMDADWDKVTYEQAPAHEGYANYPLGREFLMGGAKVPGFVQDSLNGGFLRIAQSMGLQITGGSTAVRFTGMGGMRIAGAAAREMIVKAAAKTWKVPTKELRTEKSHVYHDASGRSEPYAAFAELGKRGMTFDAWVLEPQIPDVIDLAQRFPDQPICLDHCGTPLGVAAYKGRLHERFDVWRHNIKELAACENVVVKLGGLAMAFCALPEDGPAAGHGSEHLAALWRPYIETCIEAFGPARSMYESNFPVQKRWCSYQVCWNAFKRISAGASPAEKADLFAGAAARAYRIEDV